MAEHLFVSRRGIVHTSLSLSDNAATLCGKGTRNLVYIGGVGPGERLCLSCAQVEDDRRTLRPSEIPSSPGEQS